MKFTASSEKFFEERIPGVNVPPGHWMGTKEVIRRPSLFIPSFG